MLNGTSKQTKSTPISISSSAGVRPELYTSHSYRELATPRVAVPEIGRSSKPDVDSRYVRDGSKKDTTYQYASEKIHGPISEGAEGHSPQSARSFRRMKWRAARERNIKDKRPLHKAHIRLCYLC